MSVAVVVGHPRPASRTLSAAVHVARELLLDRSAGGTVPGRALSVTDVLHDDPTACADRLSRTAPIVSAHLNGRP